MKRTNKNLLSAKKTMNLQKGTRCALDAPEKAEKRKEEDQKLKQRAEQKVSEYQVAKNATEKERTPKRTQNKIFGP